MNKIIENFLAIHKQEYDINSLPPNAVFEHFINKCIINKYSNERFNPDDIMLDEGAFGIDGIAICINDTVITTPEEFDAIDAESKKLDVKFIFIQSKTSTTIDSKEIGNFFDGVKFFFENDAPTFQHDGKVFNLKAIKDKIYSSSLKMNTSPVLDLFYVYCGTWDNNPFITKYYSKKVKELEATQNFSSVNFYIYDSEKIITSYKELKKKISRSIIMEKKITFPPIEKVNQAFLGLVKCKDFIQILTDSDGNMLTNIFEDNVRNFQGYNTVNTEIQETIKNPKDQDRFGLLNNGITIVAKNMKVIGDNLDIYDYQIVNGCQTSYVLFDNRNELSDKSYLMVKIIEVVDEEVSDKVIYTTNRQTEVKSEAFIATKPFHKRLQDYYNAIESEYRLHYERRSKQYDLNDNINKDKVVTLTCQIYSYIAMFFNEPHSTHRYYGELLRAYKSRLFLENDCLDLYFCSAYFSLYVDKMFRAGKLDKKYKKFKYHLICAMRILITTNSMIIKNNKEQEKIGAKLWTVIKNPAKMSSYFNLALEYLKKAQTQCQNIPPSEQHRQKEFTFAMIDLIENHIKIVKENKFLQKGQKVSCKIINIRKYSVDVEIDTQDERNRGSIHISKIKRKYIEDISKEVKLGEIHIAQIINDDYYEKKWGWELSLILDNK